MIYICDICNIGKEGKIFTTETKYNYNKHLESKKHLKNVDICTRCNFICKDCGKKFPSKETLKRHRDNNTYLVKNPNPNGVDYYSYNPYGCNMFMCVDECFKQEYHYDQNGKAFAKKPKRKGCRREFSSWTELTNHLLECDNIDKQATSLKGGERKISKPKGIEDRIPNLKELIKYNK